MHSGVNAWIFSTSTPIAEQARLTADAGFAALELCVDREGEFSIDTPEPACRDFGQTVRDAGLQVASLATALFWECNFGHADPAVRQQAHELCVRLLDRAAWTGADVLLVVPAVVGTWNNPAIQVSYADALNRTFDALFNLVPEAEARAVTIALENVWNKFLLSPVEARDLIDQVNCPFVGSYLDVGNVLTTGCPQDWIRILAHRIKRVHMKDYKLQPGGPDGFCPLGDGDVNWPAVITALKETGYDGPVIYEGKGDLHEAYRRLERILTSH